MKKLLTVALLITSVTAFARTDKGTGDVGSVVAGTLLCKGDIHTVLIDSNEKTILVSPEMDKAIPAEILDGPEKGLKISYPIDNTFLIYLGPKDGVTQGNLNSKADQELEEKMNCIGNLN